MAATLVCANCGAEGEANFSVNYFGELVCELCGTQSYLQNRTETQEAEDMGIDIATLGKMKRSNRKKRARKVKAEHQEARQPVRLLECIVATQYILHEQAEALVRVGFPPDFPRVVRDVWFHLLRVWHRKGARPLLRCFTEFHYQRQAADKAMDPAVTNDVLEQWDAENGGDLERLFSASQSTTTPTATPSAMRGDPHDVGPTSVPGETKHKRTRHWMHTLDWFVLPDMVGVLVLAGRLLNVAALPCDYSHWIQCGVLPYYNLLSRCPLEMQERVERVAVFFDATIRSNWISTAVIAYRAHYLQFHLEMRVPPLNASLIAFNICENLNLPASVFRHFQWLSAQFNIAGELPERPIQQKPLTRFQDTTRGSALDSGAGIAAYLLAAIRLCPNWNEWIYEHVGQRDQHVPPYSLAEADKLPRRELGAFVDFCEDILLGTDRGRIPDEFTAHVDALKTDLSQHKAHYFSNTYETHALRAYPAEYEGGVCVETTEEMQRRVERIKTHHGIMSGMADEKMALDDDGDRTVKPTLFYPLYARKERFSFHAPFEAALELLAEYIDCPMGVVMKWVDVIDRGLRDRELEFRPQRPERSEEEHEEATQEQADMDHDVERDQRDQEPPPQVESHHLEEAMQIDAAGQEDNRVEMQRSKTSEETKEEEKEGDVVVSRDQGLERPQPVAAESHHIEVQAPSESQPAQVEIRAGAKRRGRPRKLPKD